MKNNVKPLWLSYQAGSVNEIRKSPVLINQAEFKREGKAPFLAPECKSYFYWYEKLNISQGGSWVGWWWWFSVKSGNFTFTLTLNFGQN